MCLRVATFNGEDARGENKHENAVHYCGIIVLVPRTVFALFILRCNCTSFC